jgi:hypothetical protein
MFRDNRQRSDVQFEKRTLALKLDLQGFAGLAWTAIDPSRGKDRCCEIGKGYRWYISVRNNGVGDIVRSYWGSVLELKVIPQMPKLCRYPGNASVKRVTSDLVGIESGTVARGLPVDNLTIRSTC